MRRFTQVTINLRVGHQLRDLIIFIRMSFESTLALDNITGGERKLVQVTESQQNIL